MSLLPGLGSAARLAGAAGAPEDGAEDASGNSRGRRVDVRRHVLGPEHLLVVARLLLLLLLLLRFLVVAVVTTAATSQHADAPDAPGVPQLRLGLFRGAIAGGLRLRVGLGQETLVPDQP